MLSILIPVYNYDVSRLVTGLNKQLLKSNIEYEIILLDDGSHYDFWVKNAKLDFNSHVIFLRNNINVGRAKVRNTLVDHAHFPYILFIDGDAAMVDNLFIDRYLQQIKLLDKESFFVIQGGVAYRSKPPKSKKKQLRWYYGVHREQIPAAQRSLFPYKSFTPFNVLMTRSVFSVVRFEESIVGYGNEDTLFGYQLKEAEIPVYHIDNPLYHEGLDDNKVFVEKITTAVDNLVYLIDNHFIKENYWKGNRLLAAYTKSKRWRINGIMSLLYKRKSANMKSMLLRRPSLFLLDLYKLMYLSFKMSSKK